MHTDKYENCSVRQCSHGFHSASKHTQGGEPTS